MLEAFYAYTHSFQYPGSSFCMVPKLDAYQSRTEQPRNNDSHLKQPGTIHVTIISS